MCLCFSQQALKAASHPGLDRKRRRRAACLPAAPGEKNGRGSGADNAWKHEGSGLVLTRSPLKTDRFPGRWRSFSSGGGQGDPLPLENRFFVDFVCKCFFYYCF